MLLLVFVTFNSNPSLCCDIVVFKTAIVESDDFVEGSKNSKELHLLTTQLNNIGEFLVDMIMLRTTTNIRIEIIILQKRHNHTI